MPLRGMTSPTPEKNRLPPTVAAEDGEKATFKVALCPGSRVSGNEGPLTENPAPVVCSAERITLHARAFVITTGWVDLVPSAAWPKVTTDGLAVTASLETPVPPTGRGK